jgi:hypothetical protein
MTDDCFGPCPHCHKTDGFINVGSDHWFFCKEHRTKWLVGSNLFSSWKGQSAERRLAQYRSMDFGKYTEVVPCFRPKIVRGIRHFLMDCWPARKYRAHRNDPIPF